MCVVLALAVSVTTSCSLLHPKSDITWEASRFLSFQDVYTVTRTAYAAHLDRVAAGKVKIEDQKDIDKAWNTFRTAYLLALDSAEGNTEVFTPDNVKKLADDLLILIASL